MTNKLNCIMLVDDDDDDNFFHEKEIIDNHFADIVIIKDSGKKALEYLKTKTDPVTDLIFLDINMPGMTGWEFLDAYQKLSADLQKNTVIVMLSTSANPRDIEKSETWDFVSDFVTKPLTKERLKCIIDEHCMPLL